MFRKTQPSAATRPHRAGRELIRAIRFNGQVPQRLRAAEIRCVRTALKNSDSDLLTAYQQHFYAGYRPQGGYVSLSQITALASALRERGYAEVAGLITPDGVRASRYITMHILTERQIATSPDASVLALLHPGSVDAIASAVIDHFTDDWEGISAFLPVLPQPLLSAGSR